jgi:hypothetical protein
MKTDSTFAGEIDQVSAKKRPDHQRNQSAKPGPSGDRGDCLMDVLDGEEVSDTDDPHLGFSPSSSSGGELLLGKSEPASPAAITALVSPSSDPIYQGTQVVAGFKEGVRSLVEACRRIRDARESFRGSREKEDAFIAVLVEGRLLSTAEGQLGFSSPKLSKLCKIGDSADLLERPEIIKLLTLESGYSVLYELVLLYEAAISGAGNSKFPDFLREVEACEGPLTREYLDKRKRAHQAIKTDVIPSDIWDEVTRDQSADPASAEFHLPSQVLMLTPRDEDWRWLRQDYPDDAPLATLARTLPLHENVGPDAALVVFAELRQLFTVERVLLALCGFDKVFQVHLLRRPDSPDVTRAQVIVVAKRGRMTLRSLDEFQDDGPLDTPAIAARLVPDAIRRCHAFASKATSGWHSIIGDDTWAEKPSLS